jgi:hypothetical protein
MRAPPAASNASQPPSQRDLGATQYVSTTAEGHLAADPGAGVRHLTDLPMEALTIPAPEEDLFDRPTLWATSMPSNARSTAPEASLIQPRARRLPPNSTVSLTCLPRLLGSWRFGCCLSFVYSSLICFWPRRPQRETNTPLSPQKYRTLFVRGKRLQSMSAAATAHPGGAAMRWARPSERWCYHQHRARRA